jgi:hypothetical protein
MTNQNSDVDVNVLIKVYNQKLTSLTNQNVLLEAKLNTIAQDFFDEKNKILEEKAELQEKYDNLLSDIDPE